MLMFEHFYYKIFLKIDDRSEVLFIIAILF